MAATVVSAAGASVSLYEKRRAIGRKLLVAGSSGLNISNDLPLDEFVRHYSGPPKFWDSLIRDFPPSRWIEFIEGLGIGTFVGSSGRYFIEDMKAPRFLQAWRERLKNQGVEFVLGREFMGFEPGGWLELSPDERRRFDAVCFCLGGGSWEDSLVRWPEVFKTRGVGFHEFEPSNVGYRVDWPKEFLQEAEGKPIKNAALSSTRGTRRGEVMITRYGIEGTPVYFVGETGRLSLDLFPDQSAEQILNRLKRVKENLSPVRRVKKLLNLGEAALALIFHCAPREARIDVERLVRWMKGMPLNTVGPQPLQEAISSSGGIALDELDSDLMLKKFPAFFCAGEMLDWDVPTGGFLIQGCVVQGYRAGRGILKHLNLSSP